MSEKPEEKSSSSSFVAILLVPLFLYFFAVFKTYMGGIDIKTGIATGDNPAGKIPLLTVAFLVVLFLMMYSFNVKEMSKHCPPTSKGFALKSFLYSFIPYVFIMGTMVVILNMMPGWKSPFSNTIGYFIVKNVIARKLFKLQKWIKVQHDDGNNHAQSLIEKFNSISNRTFFVNELTPKNFFYALKSLGISSNGKWDFQQKDVDIDPITNKPITIAIAYKLYQAIIIKDLISEFIWYFLAAMLTYSVSQLYILGHICDKATEDSEAAKLLGALNEGKKSAQDMAKETKERTEEEFKEYE
jgi:hypothetical protein